MKKRRNISISVLLIFGMFVCMLTGCSGKSGKEEKVTEIEILQYKQEAAAYFEKVEEKFNATHKNIRLKIESPNDASTIMRTRFIRKIIRILSGSAAISIIPTFWMPRS